MKKVSLAQATSMTFPNPVTVVCTEKSDGSTNKIPKHSRVAIQCRLKDKNTDEEKGGCYGFSFLYSGEFLMEAEKDQIDQT